VKKVVLGKGLDALIPAGGEESGGAERRLRHVPVDRINPNPMQPRRDFDEASLHELADSFKRNGIMQPLVVRQDGSMFTIIAGERRYRAARLAGLTHIPVVVMDEVDEPRMLELALVENLQREDLNPIETAQAYRSLMDRCGHTQNELAVVVGKSRAAVANALRLLTLPEKVRDYIRAGRITEGHARAILQLEDEQAMVEMAERIAEESLSVRSVEEQTRRPSRRKGRPAQRRKNPALEEAESFLKRTLGTAVRIKHGPKRGRIEIEYYGDEDLNRLLEMLGSIGG
jgi:ParB family chromosome partitioning protein